MRTAVIEIATGRVVNVIERGLAPPNPRVVEATEPPEGFAWLDHETAGVGWMLVDGALVKPEEPKPEPTAQQKIADLERTEGQGVYVRGVREFMLGMAQIIVAQGGPDIVQTPGMQSVKKLDDKIKALRSQIK
jgi:hypothetical protein